MQNQSHQMIPLQRGQILDTVYSDGGRQVGRVHAITPEITAANIARMSYEACQDPYVVERAKQIVVGILDENQNMFLSKLSEVNAVRNWVSKHVRYTRDPKNVELVYNPRRLLQAIDNWGKIGEDCDSISGLVATLLCALGHHCKITIAGFNNRPGFSHVFAQVLLPPAQRGGKFFWVVVDPSVGNHVQKMCRDISHHKSFEVGSLK